MKDYEREDAREWDLDARSTENKAPISKYIELKLSEQQHADDSSPPSRSYARTTPQRKKERGTATKAFIGTEDNAGTILWRRNEPPITKLTLGSFAPFLLQRDGNGDNLLNTLAKHTKTHVKLEKDTCLIWGEEKQAAEARAQLIALIKDANNQPVSKGKAGPWASYGQHRNTANSEIDKKYLAIRAKDRKMGEEVDMRQELRRIPLPDTVFEAVGYFTWPPNDIRPEEIFGHHFEGLDRVRTENCCYIVFDKTLKAFKIMGRAENVPQALCRLRAITFQIAARQADSLPVRLFRRPRSKFVPSRLYLIDCIFPQVIHPKPFEDTRLKTGKRLRAGALIVGDVAYESVLKEQTTTNHRTIRNNIMQAVSKSRFFWGNVELRARLGTFSPMVFKDSVTGTYELADFESMVADPRFLAKVTNEIGHHSMEQKAKDRLCSATDFLRPTSMFCRRLKDVQPVYKATLTLEPPELDYIVQLSKSWQDNYSSLDHVSTKWMRLDKTSSPAPAVLLDMSITDIADGFAWQFDMLGTQIVNEDGLPRWLKELAEWRLAVVPDAAHKLDPLTHWWRLDGPAYGKKSVEQRVAWHYNITNSDYTLELAQVQDMKWVPSPKGGPPGITDMLEKYEPYWTLSVTNRIWESNFSQNCNVGLGRGATWAADLQSWFPADSIPGRSHNRATAGAAGDGFEAFMQKLDTIRDVIIRYDQTDTETEIGHGRGRRKNGR